MQTEFCFGVLMASGALWRGLTGKGKSVGKRGNQM
jgi:hypothetical protein